MNSRLFVVCFVLRNQKHQKTVFVVVDFLLDKSVMQTKAFCVIYLPCFA